MFLINQVTDQPLQQMNLALQDGTFLSLTIYWMEQQQTWMIRNLTYQDFVINGLRITVSPNMLNQWRNQIPFGLACYSDGNREPSLQQDFSSSACVLYLLSSDEVNQYALLLSMGTP